jgi:hypothetical protein
VCLQTRTHAHLHLCEEGSRGDAIHRAFNYANDSELTDVCVRYSLEVVACACILLASRTEGVALPEVDESTGAGDGSDQGGHFSWWTAFEVDRDSVCTCARIIYSVYSRPRRTLLELQTLLDGLRAVAYPGVSFGPSAVVQDGEGFEGAGAGAAPALA